MKNTKSISKIKINEKKVEVHYTMHHFTEDERVLNTQIPMKSEVKPHLDFHNAFQALKIHAIAICELSMFKNKVDEKTLKNHVVTTLNIIEDDDDVRVIISMNKYISSGKCYNVNTPLISVENEDYENLIDLAEAIDNVIAEAREYLKGKNGEEQLTLNFEAA